MEAQMPFWKVGKQVYLLIWSISLLLNPDPDFQYGSGSESRGANSLRIHADPDPKHCYIITKSEALITPAQRKHNSKPSSTFFYLI